MQKKSGKKAKILNPNQKVLHFYRNSLFKSYEFGYDLVAVLTGIALQDPAERDIFSHVVVDLHCNIGTFAYGALCNGCQWYGWEPLGNYNAGLEATGINFAFQLKLSAHHIAFDEEDMVDKIMEHCSKSASVSTNTTLTDITVDAPEVATQESQIDPSPSTEEEILAQRIQELQNQLASKRKAEYPANVTPEKKHKNQE